ncbi:MAG: hypothetical protein R2816_06755 [Flavobacteriaceae bacterium]|nr:hypothetical protein [Flavobacteriaceae bacterium]
MNFENTKYLGCLKSYDLANDLYDSKNLEILEKMNIISNGYEYDENNDACSRNIYLTEDGKFYTLSKNFVNEVYEFIEIKIHSLKNEKVYGWGDGNRYDYINIVQLNASIIDRESKIKFLKKIYKEIHQETLSIKLNSLKIIRNNTESNDFFSPFFKKPKPEAFDTIYGYDVPIRRLYNDYLGINEETLVSWKEWVIYQFDCDKFLIKYLTLKKDQDYEIELKDFWCETNFKCYDLFMIWSNFAAIKKISKFLNEELGNLGVNKTSLGLSALEVAYYAYYMREAKEKIVSCRFPSEEAYKELQNRFGANWKNIQQSYNEINNNRNMRLKSSRKKKVENVMPLLTPKALSLAEFDLINM